MEKPKEEPTIMGNIYVSLSDDKKVGFGSFHFSNRVSYINC